MQPAKSYGNKCGGEEKQGDCCDDTHIGTISTCQQGHPVGVKRDRSHDGAVVKAQLSQSNIHLTILLVYKIVNLTDREIRAIDNDTALRTVCS